MPSNVDKRILALAKKIKAKRPKTVIDHIIKHGSVSTEELQNLYGYEHPPRAARDVREAGIPLETFKVTASNGRKIGAYRFANPDEIQSHKFQGRQTFSKAFKIELVELYGEKCAITNQAYESRYLQIDHRIPYEVAGEGVETDLNPKNFMLLTGAAQRQKSWSCEHCPNLLNLKNLNLCKTCYWAYPENYTHIATIEARQLLIEWKGEEIDSFIKIEEEAKTKKISLQDFIKQKLNR